MEKQTKPCPECGKTVGWWSPVERKSMVFRNEHGETTERRIYENAKRKHCANCDADISKCVE